MQGTHQNLNQLLQSSHLNIPTYKWMNQAWTLFPLTTTTNPSSTLPTTFPLTTLTFNILFDYRPTTWWKRVNLKQSQTRFQQTLSILQQTLPTWITLQQVTIGFMIQLQACQWVRTHYFLSQISTNPHLFNNTGFGNLLLSRLPPLALHSLSTPSLPRNTIIGFYILPYTPHTTFCISSIHLTAFSNNSQRRNKELTHIVNYLFTYYHYIDCFLLQGDLNIHLLKEQAYLQGLDLRDAWKQRNIDQGYTFDSQENRFIQEIYWGWEKRRMRLDRIMFFGKGWSTNNQLLQHIDEQQQAYLTKQVTVRYNNDGKSIGARFSSLRLCFKEPIFNKTERSDCNMGWVKSILSCLFDLFGVNAFRSKEQYLYCSDHFGIEGQIVV